MIRTAVLIVLITSAVLCESCSSGRDLTVSGYDPFLENHEWRLEETQSRSVTSGSVNRELTLRFDTTNHLFSGDGGCNLMSGRYSVDGNKIVMRNLTSTRIRCPQYSLENLYFNIIQSADQYEIINNRLILYDRGKRIAEFSRRDAAQ